ncbi:MAG: hypothetical protein ACLTK0_09480 [Anaerovoracaceae bacterium]
MEKTALNSCVELFKEEFPSIGCVELMHYPDDNLVTRDYEALGFIPTGELRRAAVQVANRHANPIDMRNREAQGGLTSLPFIGETNFRNGFL